MAAAAAPFVLPLLLGVGDNGGYARSWRVPFGDTRPLLPRVPGDAGLPPRGDAGPVVLIEPITGVMAHEPSGDTRNNC